MSKLHLSQEVEDLASEHSQHYSDEWETLQDRCSSCYNSVRNFRPTATKEERKERFISGIDQHIENQYHA